MTDDETHRAELMRVMPHDERNRLIRDASNVIDMRDFFVDVRTLNMARRILEKRS